MAWILGDQDRIEVSYFCQQNEQISVNVIHYQVSGIVGTPTYEQLADDIAAGVATAYKAWINDDAVFSGVKILLAGEVLKPQPVYSAGGAGAGGSGGSLPRQAAGLIRKRIDRAGPAGRGRVYAPFPGIDFLEAGELSAAGQTALGNLRTALFGNPGPIAYTPGTGDCLLTPVLFNRANNAFSLIISTQIAAHYATQRRRGFYGRINSLPAELT